jgi:hypothetical protein
MGSKTIYTGTLIEVLAPGPDLQSILDNITDASADKPYLVKLGPGVYDLGTTSLVMESHVEIRGSGQDVTLIKGDVGHDSLWEYAAVIYGANDATLSHLTVENTGNTFDLSAAIYNSSKSPTLRHVTLKTYTAGNRIPVHNAYGASPMIMDSTLIAGGSALYSYSNCHPTVIRSYLKGGGGQAVYTKSSSSTHIEHSYIESGGAIATVRTDGSGATTDVFSSTLSGGTADAINSGTPPKCAGVADENNTFYPASCP